MFKHVQHGNKRVLLTRTEVIVERANINAVSMRVMRTDQINGRFYTLHFTKFAKPVKKQTIPTANIKDAFALASWSGFPKSINDQFSSGTPPPVFLEKFTICFAILGPPRALPSL